MRQLAINLQHIWTGSKAQGMTPRIARKMGRQERAIALEAYLLILMMTACVAKHISPTFQVYWRLLMGTSLHCRTGMVIPACLSSHDAETLSFGITCTLTVQGTQGPLI